MSVKELTTHLHLSLHLIAQKYGVKLATCSIGLIYIWFGTLKFFSGYSPAEHLASETLAVLTFDLIDKQLLLWGLALWELLIGIFFFFRIRSKIVIWAILLHMIGTLLPMVFFPDVVFSQPPFGFSIVGQYIMKNLVIISAVLIIYGKN